MSRQARSPLRVLVADDDPAIRKLVSLILERRGHKPTLVASGAEALLECRSGPFNLIVLDYEMGSPTGLEVLAQLRSEGFSTAILLMSGNLTSEVVTQALRHPGVTCLPKPYGVPEFEAAVARAVGQAGSIEDSIFGQDSSACDQKGDSHPREGKLEP